MVKKIPGDFFAYTAEYAFTEYACMLPPGFGLDDLFHPVTWSLHSKKFNVGDRVRVRTNDGSIDIMVVVDAVTVGGVHVSEWPKFNGVTGGAALAEVAKIAKEKTISIVPLDTDGMPKVRVQHLPATDWRVLGLNGEIARGMKTEAEALAKMHEYLNQAGLKMPEAKAETSETMDEAPAPKPARKSAKAKDAA